MLDLLLPGLDGHSVLRATIGSRPEQKVLVLSAISDVSSKVHCLESGACDYLTKPFELTELIARVRRHLQQPGSGSEGPVVAARSIELDAQRRVATVGDRSVVLSAREFALLLYLSERSGQVCSRQELLADVWGYSFDPGSNVVDVYVRRLRAKLGGNLIQTVRRAGYRLEAP